VSYYAKGSLVALALDLELRRSTAHSLDDVMRALWQHYGRPAVGVPEDGVRRIVEDIAGRDMASFFNRYVDGTDDLPLAELLDAAGITYSLRAASSATDRGGNAASGASPRSTVNAKVGADMRLVNVYAGGAAERAGLAGNDTLVAVDGIKAGVEALRVLFERRAPGEKISVHAFRRDELIERTLELAAPALDTCFLSVQDDAPEPSVARRNAWLRAG
jgi:predicted metalloprotease with PDZ domain